MSRQISDSTLISTTQVATSVGFNAGEYVYSYGANIVGAKAAANLGALVNRVGGTTYTDYIVNSSPTASNTLQGPLLDSVLYSGTSITTGGIVNSATAVNAINSYNKNKVAALTNGSSVYIYFTNTTTIVGAIYDSTGTIVGSSVVITATASSSTTNPDSVCVTGLSNGGYVVGWTDSSGLVIAQQVSSANALYLSAVTVESTGIADRSISVCANVSGGYTFAYVTSSIGGNTYSVKRYLTDNTLLTSDVNRSIPIYPAGTLSGTNTSITIVGCGDGTQAVISRLQGYDSSTNATYLIINIHTYNTSTTYVANSNFYYLLGISISATYQYNVLRACAIGSGSKIAIGINALPATCAYVYYNGITSLSSATASSAYLTLTPVSAATDNDVQWINSGTTITTQYAAANSTATAWTLGAASTIYNTLSVNSATSVASLRNGKTVIGYSLAVRTGTIAATVATAGTAGQFTCGNSTLAVGDKVNITGTLGGTGTITGYTTGTRYTVSSVTGTSPTVTGFTLQSDTGAAIVTTAGTLTGLTYVTDLNAPQRLTVYSYTATNGVSIISNNTSPAEGYNLIGVAVTGAAAGSTGVVQTKGIAKLSASSVAVTGSISFNSQGTIYGGQGSGNSGTVVGTTVTLGGL